jgi:TolA-binding protein/frataxin-like iron-binding protein CyaY
MKKILREIVLLSVLLPSSLFADVIDPLYSTGCMDFSSQYTFIGTPFGLSVYDKKRNHWLELDKLWISEKKTVTEQETPYGGAISILSVLSDSDWIWIAGGERKGVFRTNITSGETEWWVNSQKELIGRSTHSKGGVPGPTFECPFPSNTVVSIKKDRKGNILFATLFGIAQFNGENWRIFPAYFSSAGFGEKSGIDACITSIAVDNINRLWIGTSDFYYAYYELEGAPETENDINGGLILYDGKIWKHFYAYNYNLKQEDSLHIKAPLLSNDVTCVEVDGDEVWIATRHGLNVYNPKINEWRSYDKKDCAVLGTAVTSIAITPDFIWVASRNGVAKFDKKANKWTTSGHGILPFESIKSIAYDSYGKGIWAVTALSFDKDAYVYKYKQGKWTIYPTRKRLVLKNPEELMNFALFLKKSEVKEEAKSMFKELIKEYPGYERSLQAKYELLLLEGLDEEKVKEFQENYPSSPYAISLYRALGEHYKIQKKWTEAIKYFDIYIRNCKSSEHVFEEKYAMSQCYGANREYKKQVALLEDIYLAYPEEARRWKLRLKIGDIYRDKIHNYRKAIEWYEKKLTVGNYTYGIRVSDARLLRIGECYERLGEYDKAIATYEKIQTGWKLKEAKNRIERIRQR